MELKPVSAQTLQRLPLYLSYLKSLPGGGAVNTSATAIADALELNDVQVRKDLASVCTGGRRRVGYIARDLISELERYLGFDDVKSAVIVGAGNLGRALLSYDGFTGYGLDIVAAFDVDEAVIGTTVNGKKILPVEKLKGLCSSMKIRTGIITVPASAAQGSCDALIEGGVLAIWNFAPVHLNAPKDILVKNENMASSLAVLCKHLTDSLYGKL